MSKNVMTKEKFKNQWLRKFAPDLTEKQKDEYSLKKYIWHIFSYELFDFDGLLIGDKAREAFDKIDKSECIICDMFNHTGVSDKLSEEYNTAGKIDNGLREVYIVSKDFSWTYIKTHEEICGPYFLKRK